MARGKHFPFFPSSSFPLMPPLFAGPSQQLACKVILEIELCNVQSSTPLPTPIHRQDSQKWSCSTRAIMSSSIRILLLCLSSFPSLNDSHGRHAIQVYLQLSDHSLHLEQGRIEELSKLQESTRFFGIFQVMKLLFKYMPINSQDILYRQHQCNALDSTFQ